MVSRQDVGRYAEAGTGINNPLNVGTINGVVFKNIAGDEDRVDGVLTGNRREGFGGKDALRSHLRSPYPDVFCTHADLPIGSMQDFHSQSPQSIKRCSVIMSIGSHERAPYVWHSSFGLQEFRHRDVLCTARTIRRTWRLAVMLR